MLLFILSTIIGQAMVPGEGRGVGESANQAQRRERLSGDDKISMPAELMTGSPPSSTMSSYVSLMQTSTREKFATANYQPETWAAREKRERGNFLHFVHPVSLITGLLFFCSPFWTNG